MKKAEYKAAIKGFLYGLLFLVLFLLTRLSFSLAEKGVDGWVFAVLIFAFVLVVIGILVSFWVVPILAESIAQFFVFNGSDLYEPSTKLELAKCLILQKRYEEAADAYEEAIESEWITHHTWLEISEFYLKKLKDPNAAIETLTEAMDRHEWRIDEHIKLLHKVADIQFYELDSQEAAEGIYDFIELKYGSTPYGKTFLDRSFSMFKPEEKTV